MPQPLTELVRELVESKAVAVEIDRANAWLRPKLLAVLAAAGGHGKRELEQLLAGFSWDAGLKAFQQRLGASTLVDITGLVPSLQRHLYVREGHLGEGSHAKVYKARNRETNELLAIKKLKLKDSDGRGFRNAVIREVSILRELKQHENIIRLEDIITTVEGASVHLVLEYVECDLRAYIQALDVAPDIALVKKIMYQIIKGIEHTHSHLILHRDLKPENILIDARTHVVKLADFGLARQFLPSEQEYTNKVVTLYYRAPELLLANGDREAQLSSYNAAVDMWSVGCILAELVNLEPLFRADVELGLLKKITETLGTPSVEEWPRLHHSGCQAQLQVFPRRDLRDVCPRLANEPLALDLLARLLTFDPGNRMTARQALMHPWFSPRG